MTYRDPPASTPLITCIGGYLMALDPEHGTPIWSHVLDRKPGRVLHVGALVFMTTHTTGMSSSLLIFDARTGALKWETGLGFQVQCALARGDRVYFAGPYGLIALSAEGAILFRHTREVRDISAWDGDSYDVVLRDSKGSELGRTPERHQGMHEALLVLGDLVSQPDFDT